MPKLKTRKSVAKKIKITKNGKVIRRSTGQNHYNSKETGATKRSKRSTKRMFSSDERNIVKAMPNSL